jgi:RND family efflux transporter MFP subunit
MADKRITALSGAVLVAIQLAACQPAEVPEAEPIRAVKLATVAAGTENTVQFVAAIRQAQHVELSFESGGRIAAIDVDVGDRVRQGQVLATIDAEPARLQAALASARQRAARAQLDEKRNQLRQQQALFADGVSSSLTLDAARTAVDVEQAEVQAASAELLTAQRAARNTVMRAPFDGSVVERLLQPGTVIEPGQTVLRLEGTGQLQAVATVPAAALAHMVPGQKVPASRSGLNFDLTLRGFADHLDAGGAADAIFDLPRNTTGLRSGEVLAVTLKVGRAAGIRVPVTAVLPSTAAGFGHVFVFHERKGMVEKRAVKVGELSGTDIAIADGLAAGDRIVTAGAPFLANLQKVVPYRALTKLTQEAQ